MSEGESLTDSLGELAAAIGAINDSVYQVAAARALDVLATPSPSRKAVEYALDEFLDSAGMSDRGLRAFKYLCRTWYRDYPDLVNTYVNIYLEMYGEEE